MHWIAQLAIALVALLHIGFLILEMALWDTPRGRKVFNLDPDFATKSRALAANQGLYNGFLAAGLFWSLWPIGTANAGQSIATFFLICVIIAGMFGAATANRRILFVQALPGLIALILVWALG